MDEIDHKILARLARDGRISWADLAAELGLSAPATADRVRKLEERGVIAGYHAALAPKALGYALTAYIAVVLAENKHRARFLELVRTTPEILECHHVATDDDFLLRVRCRDTEDLERLLTDVIKRRGGVSRTRTTIVLSTMKDLSAGESLTSPRAKE